MFVTAENEAAGNIVASWVTMMNWARINAPLMINVSGREPKINEAIEICTNNLTVDFGDLCTIIANQGIADTTSWKLLHFFVKRQDQAIFIVLVNFASLRTICGYGYKNKGFSFGARRSYAAIWVKQEQLMKYGYNADGKETNVTKLSPAKIYHSQKQKRTKLKLLSSQR